MRILLAMLMLAVSCSCATPDAMTVDTNVRMEGEPATAARPLTPAERREVVQAIASSEPAGVQTRPLEPAGPGGRWREVGVVAREAAKACEMAVVSETRTDGCVTFRIRSLRDEQGRLVVRGDERLGVTAVEAQVGAFDENRSAADALQEAFWRKLREYARIPRPQ